MKQRNLLAESFIFLGIVLQFAECDFFRIHRFRDDSRLQFYDKRENGLKFKFRSLINGVRNKSVLDRKILPLQVVFNDDLKGLGNPLSTQKSTLSHNPRISLNYLSDSNSFRLKENRRVLQDSEINRVRLSHRSLRNSELNRENYSRRSVRDLELNRENYYRKPVRDSELNRENYNRRSVRDTELNREKYNRRSVQDSEFIRITKNKKTIHDTILNPISKNRINEDTELNFLKQNRIAVIQNAEFNRIRKNRIAVQDSEFTCVRENRRLNRDLEFNRVRGNRRSVRDSEFNRIRGNRISVSDLELSRVRVNCKPIRDSEFNRVRDNRRSIRDSEFNRIRRNRVSVSDLELNRVRVNSKPILESEFNRVRDNRRSIRDSDFNRIRENRISVSDSELNRVRVNRKFVRDSEFNRVRDSRRSIRDSEFNQARENRISVPDSEFNRVSVNDKPVRDSEFNRVRINRRSIRDLEFNHVRENRKSVPDSEFNRVSVNYKPVRDSELNRMRVNSKGSRHLELNRVRQGHRYVQDSKVTNRRLNNNSEVRMISARKLEMYDEKRHSAVVNYFNEDGMKPVSKMRKDKNLRFVSPMVVRFNEGMRVFYSRSSPNRTQRNIAIQNLKFKRQDILHSVLKSLARRDSTLIRKNRRVQERGTFFKTNYMLEKSNNRKLQIARENSLHSRRNVDSTQRSAESQRRILGLENERRKEGLMMRSKRELKILNNRYQNVRGLNSETLSRIRNIEETFSRNRNGRGFRGRFGRQVYSRMSERNSEMCRLDRNALSRSDSRILFSREFENKSRKTETRETSRARSIIFHKVQMELAAFRNHITRDMSLFSNLKRYKDQEKNYQIREIQGNNKFFNENISPVNTLRFRSRSNIAFLASDRKVTQPRKTSRQDFNTFASIVRDIARTSRTLQKSTLQSNVEEFSKRTIPYSRDIRSKDHIRSIVERMSTANFRSRTAFQRLRSNRNEIGGKITSTMVASMKQNRMNRRLSNLKSLNMEKHTETINNVARNDNSRKQRISETRLNSERNRIVDMRDRHVRTRSARVKSFITVSNEIRRTSPATQPLIGLSGKNGLRVRIDRINEKQRLTTDYSRMRISNIPSNLQLVRHNENELPNKRLSSLRNSRKVEKAPESVSYSTLIENRRLLNRRSRTNSKFETSYPEKVHSMRLRVSEEPINPIHASSSIDRRLDRRTSRYMEFSPSKSSKVIENHAEEVNHRETIVHLPTGEKTWGLHLFSFRNDRFFSFTFDVLLGLVILTLVTDDPEKGFISRFKSYLGRSRGFQYRLIKT